LHSADRSSRYILTFKLLQTKLSAAPRTAARRRPARKLL
jgi:hypothetical protein